MSWQAIRLIAQCIHCGRAHDPFVPGGDWTCCLDCTSVAEAEHRKQRAS